MSKSHNINSPDAVLRSQSFAARLSAAVDHIRDTAVQAESEATVAAAVDHELAELLLLATGRRPKLEKEVQVGATATLSVGRGRADSIFGAIVVEYKHPTKLRTAALRLAASTQLSAYLQAEHRRVKHDLLGVLTDGLTWQLLHVADGRATIGVEQPLRPTHLRGLVEGFLSLERVALTSKNLLRDFCEPESKSLSRRLFRALLDAITRHQTEKTAMLFAEWQRLFRLAHDDKSKQKAIEERRRALEEIAGEAFPSGNNHREYHVLFCLQTTHAIIVKAIAHNVLAGLGTGTDISLASLPRASDDAIRAEFARWEAGRLFRESGIRNLLEGDFFLWYCASTEQWTASLAAILREVVAALVPYEGRGILRSALDLANEDLFQDLYARIMPAKVRHNLGEFYTPRWLAETVVAEALDGSTRPGWRGLDPCCGSGTFVAVMIDRVLREHRDESPALQLQAVLSRVYGFDLNPLAALTARVNYFVSIAPLLSVGSDVEIPIFLGDASYVPERTKIGDVAAYRYAIGTKQGDLAIVLPKALVAKGPEFNSLMDVVETRVLARDAKGAARALTEELPQAEKTADVVTAIERLCDELVRLEALGWNGIWGSIVANFLRTAEFAPFDILVGNPPWIDWKNLPEHYRERVKALCVDRRLFSGDGHTGGINLNICALIANVSAEKWLRTDGQLVFLMPRSLLYQQSYEGFRHFHLNAGRMYFQRVVDWTEAGHAFYPVTEKFYAFVLGHKAQRYQDGIVRRVVVKRPGPSLRTVRNARRWQGDVEKLFEERHELVGQVLADSTMFTNARDASELAQYRLVAGRCEYIGREGIEFYPQELFLHRLEPTERVVPGALRLRNFQNPDSKYPLPETVRTLETEFVFPLVKGPEIEPFRHVGSEFVVPFPYDEHNQRRPIEPASLGQRAPRLFRFLEDHKSIILSQTAFNEKIMGANATQFYALARVGRYSFARHRVGFRDNTAWAAAVFSPVQTRWGGEKIPLFQNHAASIAEHESGRFITEDEAHYICAILNCPVVSKYILGSSDARTFKIRPPVRVPTFDSDNGIHRALAAVSRQAHALASAGDASAVELQRNKAEQLYLTALRQEALSAGGPAQHSGDWVTPEG